ncbi:MAG: HlyD family type I secretion periplasmic adaptor subunit [Pandoraea sp.]|nr:HlyD family type I secretion periplasmic adaptor subunit [Pandoraea sp.]MDR3396381.1 HlyD family type I secretion periplasmic adaptor subunit [Pandoraea sp.]
MAHLRPITVTPKGFVVALAVCVLALLVWSCFMPIARIVRGDGRVVPSGHSQIVQHLEGGIISQIRVREGEQVRRGDVLVRVQDTQASAARSADESKIAYLRVKMSRLQAEAQDGPMVLADGTEKDSPLIRSEIEAFEARRTQAERQRSVMKEELAQKNSEIAVARTRLSSLQGEIAIAQSQLRLITGLVAQKAASSLESLDAQSRVQRLSSAIQETQAELVKLGGAAKEAQARIAEYDARRRSEASAELATSQLEFSRTEQELRSQSDRLDRTEVRSPVDGIVNHVYINTIGGVVKPGEPIVELTPIDDSVLIEGRIRPSDRGEIRAGLPVKIRFSAYDYAALGTLAGTVEEVSADTIADAHGDRFYRMSVRVLAKTQAHGKFAKPVVPGMTAVLDVVVGERTAMQYLLSPAFRFYESAFREAR